KLRSSSRGKVPLWLILGSCILLAGIVVFCADLALREPRLVANEAAPPSEDAPKVDYTAQGSSNFDLSELIDPKRLTGDDAADFTLPDVQTGKPVHLKDLLKRPLVLVFGSYDCTVFCAEANKVEELFQAYKDRMDFLFVQVAAPGHLVRPLEDVPTD